MAIYQGGGARGKSKANWITATIDRQASVYTTLISEQPQSLLLRKRKVQYRPLNMWVHLRSSRRFCRCSKILLGSPSDLNTGNGREGAMVCTSLGSLLRPLFYFLCSNLKANPVVDPKCLPTFLCISQAAPVAVPAAPRRQSRRQQVG